jgi:uncharacterized protein
MDEDRIEVQGVAHRSVAADRARWSLVVVESGDVPADAFARAGERLDALTRGLRDALGDIADVHTGALTVSPEHDERGRRRGVVEVSGRVTLDVPLSEAGRAADAAMSAGADHLSGPKLRVRDSEALAEGLSGEAVAAARRKAETLAAAAGRRLGRVVSVSDESRGPIPATIGFFESAPASRRSGPDLAPEDAEIVTSVRVVFALED